MTSYFARWAWLPGGFTADVRMVVANGRFVEIEAGVEPAKDDELLAGVVLAAIANTHSHAFHRALRGRTHANGGTFWTWREAMYSVAARLTPANYYALARAVFGEMVLSGVSCVGEFHYVHHQPDGTPYNDPNAMGAALIRAAGDAGVRITLLDTCYLVGGLGLNGHVALSPQQLRFGDATAADWAERVDLIGDTDQVRIGAAIHSIRAVPREELPVVVDFADERPLHFHLSEQRAENDQCLAVYGITPTELLRRAGALGPLSTAVHATHLSDEDIAELGRGGTSISMCPTTERDLADGIGPARRLLQAGAPITLGSDQNAVVDLLEEARALEMDERLASHERGAFTPLQLVNALTDAGHRSLGWSDAGRIEVGARADLVAVALDSVRTAGVDPAQALLAASGADVETVIVDGRVVVRGGVHLNMDVAGELARAIAGLF
jgi:formiminoglutamate deiminase